MQYTNTFLNSCFWKYLNDRSEKEIQYLSPIPGPNPGWYLWLKGKKGVYEFLLTECSEEEEIERSTFVLKYYPSPDEDVFDSFSCAEQVVRLSDFFDESPMKETDSESQCACAQMSHTKGETKRTKGFPRFHSRKQINSSLFTVGRIDFTLDGGSLLEMSLNCQDRITQYALEGISVPQKDGTLLQVVNPWSMDRNIPSFDICWILYNILVVDVLAKLDLYPTESERSTQPGFIYYQEKEGEIWSSVNSTVTKITHTHYFRRCNCGSFKKTSCRS